LSSESYTLYGAEVSLFSGKARAYLDYKNVPYTEVLASASVVNKTLYPKTGMKMIPVVTTPEGEFIQDTTAIIDALESRFPENSVYPTGPKQKFVGLLLELYADEWLLLPAMHYRWHYKKTNLWFILKAFGACMVPSWPRLIQPFAGILPALFFGRLYKPVLGISKHNYQDVEAWYELFLEQFEKHLEAYPYLLGHKPCIADFGFYGPLYAHLYRDPYSGKMMRKKAPRVAKWVERMQQGAPIEGDFLENDEVPETLIPMLQHMLNTQYPVLKTSIERIAKRAKEKPQQKLPRFLGQTTYTLGKVEEKRYVNTYCQWMLQRPIGHYQSLQQSEKQNLEGWLNKYGLGELASINIAQWIERKHNKLYPIHKDS
jgi:glutathione S-transferase